MQPGVLVFGDRLQLCRHMTFTWSCFYLANPRGALTERPTEVMDDFFPLQNEAYASKCERNGREEEEESMKVAVMSSHLQQIPMRDF